MAMTNLRILIQQSGPKSNSLPAISCCHPDICASDYSLTSVPHRSSDCLRAFDSVILRSADEAGTRKNLERTSWAARRIFRLAENDRRREFLVTRSEDRRTLECEGFRVTIRIAVLITVFSGVVQGFPGPFNGVAGTGCVLLHTRPTAF